MSDTPERVLRCTICGPEAPEIMECPDDEAHRHAVRDCIRRCDNPAPSDTGKLHGPRESERDCGCGWGMFCDGPGLCECRRLREIRASLRVSA